MEIKKDKAKYPIAWCSKCKKINPINTEKFIHKEKKNRM